jgi:hypothetical protein
MTAGAFPYTANVDSAELDNVPGNDSTVFNLQVNDAPGRIQFSSPTYQQNEDGALAAITLTRTSGLQGVVTVQYATTSGSAQPNVNFTPVSGVATFADGQSTLTINIPVLDDNTATQTLNVGLQLTSPTNGAALGSPANATLQILNVDVDNQSPTVTETQLFGPGAAINALILQFSERLDASRANDPFNYQIFAPSGQEVAIADVSYLDELRQVTITPAQNLSGGGFYKLIVDGSSSTGLTDLSGNLLAGNGVGGTNLVRTFARGTNLSYFDADGDRVNLRLQRGGQIEIIRAANGNAEIVSLLNTNRRSTLTGSVKRSNRGGNGQTNLGRIDGATFGSINDRLTTPPFFVNDQTGAVVALRKLVGVRRTIRLS